MKNKFYLFVGLILLAGCSADPALGPIITVETAEVGAFPRTVTLRASEYDLADVANSTYDHDIDFRSINGGQNVASYIISIAFEDNDPSNGDVSTTPVEFKNYSQSDFGDSGNDTRSLTLNFPFTEAAAATGTAIGDISPGDRFKFTTQLILDDGRVFTADNTESTIFGPAFRAFFDWNVNATCPLPDDKFVGTYAISYITGPVGPWGGDSGIRAADVTLELVPGSTTIRAIKGAVVIDAFGGFEIPSAQVEFICTEAVWKTTGPGVGCGGTSITYEQGDPFAADITNDASFTLNVNVEGRGCGYSGTDVVLFTKK